MVKFIVMFTQGKSGPVRRWMIEGRDKVENARKITVFLIWQKSLAKYFISASYLHQTRPHLQYA